MPWPLPRHAQIRADPQPGTNYNVCNAGSACIDIHPVFCALTWCRDLRGNQLAGTLPAAWSALGAIYDMWVPCRLLIPLVAGCSVCVNAMCDLCVLPCCAARRRLLGGIDVGQL